MLDAYNNLNLALTRNRTDDAQSYYSTFVEYGDDYRRVNPNILKVFQHKEAKDIWSWFKKKTNVQDKNLASCYINSMSYGDEGYAHIDNATNEKLITCIIYMNPGWHSQWSGETVFYSGEHTTDYTDNWYYTHDIIKSVLPRYGRVILFEADIPHSVRPLSKRCFESRLTFMFKLKNVKLKYIMKGIKCN